jgi:hypothetical protein
MLRYAGLLADEERWQEASSALTGAKEFDSRIMASGQFADHMDSLSAEIAAHIAP